MPSGAALQLYLVELFYTSKYFRLVSALSSWEKKEARADVKLKNRGTRGRGHCFFQCKPKAFPQPYWHVRNGTMHVRHHVCYCVLFGFKHGCHAACSERFRPTVLSLGTVCEMLDVQ